MSDSLTLGLAIFCGVFCIWPVIAYFAIKWVMRLLSRIHLPDIFERRYR